MKQFQDGSGAGNHGGCFPADQGTFDKEDEPDGAPVKVVTDDFIDPEELKVAVAEYSAASATMWMSMVIGLLKNAGWHVNYKRVERIWRL